MDVQYLNDRFVLYRVNVLIFPLVTDWDEKRVNQNQLRIDSNTDNTNKEMRYECSVFQRTVLWRVTVLIFPLTTDYDENKQ